MHNQTFGEALSALLAECHAIRNLLGHAGVRGPTFRSFNRAIDNVVRAMHSRPVRGLAYDGGFLGREPGRCPVVLDLAGMRADDVVPLTLAHQRQIGTVSVGNYNGRLRFAGRAETAAWPADGDHSSVSVAYDIHAMEHVPFGRGRRVNGRWLSGPFHVVLFSTLRSIAILPRGRGAGR